MAKKIVNPKGIVREKTYDRALKAVNRIRNAAGYRGLKSLPAGTPGDACNCPVKNALDEVGATTVNSTEIRFQVKNTVDRFLGLETARNTLFDGEKDFTLRAKVPAAIANFVREFDDRGAEAIHNS